MRVKQNQPLEQEWKSDGKALDLSLNNNFTKGNQLKVVMVPKYSKKVH